MHKRSERIASTILDRIEMKSSDHIALLYPPCVDLVSAFYACLYIGKIRTRSFIREKTNFSISIRCGTCGYSTTSCTKSSQYLIDCENDGRIKPSKSHSY